MEIKIEEHINSNACNFNFHLKIFEYYLIGLQMSAIGSRLKESSRILCHINQHRLTKVTSMSTTVPFHLSPINSSGDNFIIPFF